MTTEAGRPTRVVVDGFELNGIDDDGVVWRFESITGWHRPAGVEVEQAQRPVEHGQFARRGRRTGRVIGLVGRILAADRSLMPAAIDRLNALLAGGDFGVFEFHDRTHGMRWAQVQLLAEPDIDSWVGGPYARFQLSLLAADPYKYGATSTDSTGFSSTPDGAGLVFDLFEPGGSLSWGAGVDPGIATITNPGTADAPVVHTVAGPTPAAGFAIVELETGNRITYLGTAVPTGSTLVFDGRDSTVLIDGVADRSGDTVVEAWPVVPAGGSRSYLFEALGGSSAATLTPSCVATYW